jgi:hypothetical protein
MVLGVLFLVQVLIVTVTMEEKGGGSEARFYYVLTSVISLLGYIGIYVNLAWLSAVN